MSSKIFGLVMGQSTSGKTTLAGTLPGRTVLLEAWLKESGSPSAQAMAKKRGNKLAVQKFASVQELLAAKSALEQSADVDHVYIDGGSALTFIIGQQPENAHAIKNKTGNSFKAYDNIKMNVVEILESFAELTKPTQKHPKNVFFTLVIDLKIEGGEAIDIVPLILGRASWSEFTKIAPTIVTLVTKIDPDSKKKVRRMLTAEYPPYKGRVVGLLDDDNPGVMEADLSLLLKLIGE